MRDESRRVADTVPSGLAVLVPIAGALWLSRESSHLLGHAGDPRCQKYEISVLAV